MEGQGLGRFSRFIAVKPSLNFKLRHYRPKAVHSVMHRNIPWFLRGSPPRFARQMQRLLHRLINRFSTAYPLTCQPVVLVIARSDFSAVAQGAKARPPEQPARLDRFAVGRQADLPDGRFASLPVQPLLQKYFVSRLTQITSISPAVSSHMRGVSRSSRTRGGMRWTRQRQAMSGDGRASRSGP